MKKIFMFIAATAFTAQAWASDFESGGLYYNIKNGKAELTFQKVSSGNYAELPAAVEIPASVTYNGKSYAVASIGDLAFKGAPITAITIPASVTTISQSAFLNCELETLTLHTSGIGTAFNDMTSIKNLIVSNQVTNDFAPDAFDGTAFETINYNTNHLNTYSFMGNKSLKSLVIGNSVTVIGDIHGWYGMFQNCSNLTSITFGSSVQEICNSAFSGCGITELNLPEGVSTLGTQAFSSCKNLTEVTIPSTVSFGYSYIVFEKCPIEVLHINSNHFEPYTLYGGNNLYSCDWFWKNSSLRVVYIGSNVTKISAGMFYGCTNLETVIVPASVTAMGGDETDGYGFSALKPFGHTNATIVFAGSSIPSGWKENYKPATVVTNTVFSNGMGFKITNTSTRTVEVSQFTASAVKRSGVTSIEIPSTVRINGTNYTVTGIGQDAFRGCNKLQSVTIPNTIKTIGTYAFSSCSSLRELTIPSSVTSIGANAFGGCYALETLTFNSNAVGTAFNDLESLRNVTVGENVTSINSNAFKGCNNIENVSYNSNIQLPIALTHCKNITIGDRITSVSPYMFYENDYLESVTIGNGVTSIGEYAFYECSYLKTVNLGNSVTIIGDDAFDMCESLTSINIPNTVTSIGKWAFCVCHNLTLNVPSSVTTIDKKAFYYVKNVTYSGTATYANDDKYWGAISYNNAPDENGFVYGDTEKTILLAYVGNDENVVIPSTVQTIGEGAFQYLKHIKTVTIPESVETLGSCVFSDCKNLSSVTIPGSIKNIPSQTFLRCPLVSVNIPNGVESIGSSAFASCLQLTSITLPNTLKTIDYGVFSNCKNLTEIDIPNSVTSIGNNAFSGCSNLASVTMGANVENIGSYAFNNCISLTTLPIPAKLTTIKEWTYSGCKNAYYFSTNGKRSKTLSDKITTIGTSAFYGCNGFSKINIPNSVTTMGANVFKNCTTTTVYCDFYEKPSGWDVNWKGDAKSVFIGETGYYVIYDDIQYEIKDNKELIVRGRISNDTADIVIPAKITFNGEEYTVTEIGSKLPLGAALSSLTLPNTIKTIKKFAICYSFTVEIPSGVTEIEQTAFSNTTHIIFHPTNPTSALLRFKPWGARCLNGFQDGDFLYSDDTKKVLCFYAGTSKNVVIPNGVEEIGQYAFSGNKTIESITIPNTVKTIGTYAFSQMEALLSLDIPATVTSIGSKAFNGITIVNYTGNATYGNSDVNWGALSRNTAVTEGDFIYLDNTKKTIVKYIGNGGHVVIPNTVENIGRKAFEACQNITSIEFPENLQSIGSQAFRACTGLTETHLPNSIKSIGSQAFESCDKIIVNIPENVETIGNDAFSHCYALTDAIIPNSLTSIGEMVFYNCYALKNLYIPNTVTTIGRYAFCNCSQLESVSIPNSVSSIGFKAFSECNNASLYCQVAEKPDTWDNDFAVGVKKVVYGCIYITANSANETQGTVTGGGLYEKNSRATLTAVPSKGYHFTHWNNNVDWSPFKIAVSQEETFTASFAINTYHFLTGGANGEVAVSGTANTDGTYNHGSQITLTATPTEHYHFARWSNGATANPYTFSIASDTVITAVFEGDEFSVASTATNGTVNGTGSYAYGGEATLSATPAANYHFAGWSNGVKANPYTLTVTKDTTVNPVFAINTYNVMVATETNGTVSAKRVVVAHGDTTRVTAAPAEHYHLARWSNGSTESQYIITVTSDTLLIAEFEINRYNITVNADNGTVTGAGSYTHGATATLTATAARGYTFKGWSTGSKESSITITVEADMVITANFVANKYTVSFGNVANGTLSGDGEYDFGTEITLKADADEGFSFSKWSDGNTDNPRKVTVEDNMSLTATFVPKTYSLTLNADHGSITGAADSYQLGSKVVLTAVPDEGYHFTKWSDGNTDNPRTIIVDAELLMKIKDAEWSYTAIFEADGQNTAVVDEAATAVSVSTRRNTIVVENADAEIRIYDAMGRLVDRDVDNRIHAEFIISTEGVYIVRVGDTVKRVMIKM